MSKGFLQLMIWSLLVAVVGFGGLIWVAVQQPESLRTSRAGVPLHMPEVIHPETGEPIPVDRLVRHYKGE